MTVYQSVTNIIHTLWPCYFYKAIFFSIKTANSFVFLFPIFYKTWIISLIILYYFVMFDITCVCVCVYICTLLVNYN